MGHTHLPQDISICCWLCQECSQPGSSNFSLLGSLQSLSTCIPCTSPPQYSTETSVIEWICGLLDLFPLDYKLHGGKNHALSLPLCPHIWKSGWHIVGLNKQLLKEDRQGEIETDRDRTGDGTGWGTEKRGRQRHRCEQTHTETPTNRVEEKQGHPDTNRDSQATQTRQTHTHTHTQLAPAHITSHLKNFSTQPSLFTPLH